MLTLERLPGQGITIGENIEVILKRCGPGRAVIGISAPREISVRRSELERTHQPEVLSPLAGVHISAAKVAELAAWFKARANSSTHNASQAYEYCHLQLLSLIPKVPA